MTSRARVGTLAAMKTRIIEALATGLYLGKARYAPGTFGTVLGLPLAWALYQGGPLFYMAGTLAAIFGAVVVSELHERRTKSHDPKEIVIDEIVGYAVAFLWLPLTWQSFAAAFVLFRFFDILKPGPIRMIDRKLEGGFGTVMDDVAAGLATNVILQIVYLKTSWLGAQLSGTGL